MPVPATIPVESVEDVTQRRRRLDLNAPCFEDEIVGAVETLVEAGALPRDGWRRLAFVMYCRAVYATHVRDLEPHLTFAEIANHLTERDVPRYRGETGWTASAVTDLRAAVADPRNQIMLPDP